MSDTTLRPRFRLRVDAPFPDPEFGEVDHHTSSNPDRVYWLECKGFRSERFYDDVPPWAWHCLYNHVTGKSDELKTGHVLNRKDLP